jgi:hypothetical protein
MTFSIDNYDELMALHRALMEAKFSESPNDLAVQGSSLLSKIANNVVESLTAMDIEKDGESSTAKWQKWREVIPERREYKIVQAKLKSESSWIEWDQSEQIEYVQSLFSPLQASEEIISALLNSINTGNQ